MGEPVHEWLICPFEVGNANAHAAFCSSADDQAASRRTQQPI